MSAEIVIDVKNISKVYKLYAKPADRLKEALHPMKKKYHNDYAALDNVSFQVRKKEIVGILGTNGSGKSTILKIITGLLNPTNGTVSVLGKISALLELGAGFNQELTGIENIYLNGSMMNLSKDEIDKKLQQILDFADIGEFVYQPVKTYSSGMFARLAFAVAINVEPDILIVDEALAVGDMFFQEKCYEKMKEMVQSGATILFVSHSLSAIRNFCSRAVWIEKGILREVGPADEICEKYKYFIEQKEAKEVVKAADVEEPTDVPADKARNKIFVKNFQINKNVMVTGEDIVFTIELGFRASGLKYGVGLIIYNEQGDIVTLFNTVRDDINLEQPYSVFKIKVENNDFLDGRYFISVHISDEMVMYPYDRNDYISEFRVLPKKNLRGLPVAEGFFRCKHEWEILE
ncbi:ABC transporter ATP-binding protein [Paenibacillus sp. JNUCC31]|uniref:ABC transporter ATP-binding protein n=1 Tax=Paenibacillus sp. JNUCC-31 TaxID=2777983 RepID=UPI00178374BC|nr:ABC transporter ATP-binding protein [Paenibacillus sp. JNUCC-31]QOS81365.1 ABC transporter ATP-binding protein [Paenibacillus sp. JNUCC-31]